MKTLDEVYYLMSLASAAMVDGDALTCPVLWSLTGDAENEFLHLHLPDGRNLAFAEGSNQRCPVTQGRLTLRSTEGQVVHLTLLVVHDLD